MRELFNKISDLIARRERREVKLLFGLMLGMAAFELVGIASIMPFVAVVANPSVVTADPRLAALYAYFEFSNPQQFLFWLGMFVLAAFLAALGFKALTTYAIQRFSNKWLHSISCRLLAAYLRQPYVFFLGRNTADLGKSVLSEVQQVVNGVMITSLHVASGAVVAVAILTLLLVVEPSLSLAAGVVFGGAYALIYVLTRRVLTRAGKDRLQANQRRFILANEALNGIKELRLLGREGGYLDRFKDPSERYARHLALSKLIGDIPQYGIQAIAFGGLIALILYLLGAGLDTSTALPIIALFAFAGYRLMPAFQTIFHNLTQLRFYLPAVDTLYRDLKQKEADVVATDANEAVAGEGPYGDIRFENVSFQYPGSSESAVSEISFYIRRHTSVGLVGATGAGKSTLVDLLLGLLEPTTGRILVDGKPLEGFRVRQWQRHVGYVPQSIFLADDSISANIAFGLPYDDIDQAAVERAAKMAQIHSFVADQLPEGYSTVVGERGIRLSGGQRQRIVIARALYHQPEILVFDEATSALDKSTETSVIEAIRGLHGRMTIIMIAHRLSTVQQCDEIHFLEHGRLNASGTFQELLANHESFQRLVEMSEAQ